MLLLHHTNKTAIGLFVKLQIMKKYEVKQQYPFWGVWNNDMCAFQFVDKYSGSLTLNKSWAEQQCKILNDKN